MKVCCLIDSLGSGGAQRQIVNLAIGLKNKGIDVYFLTYHSADFFQYKLEDNNIVNNTIKAKNIFERLIKIRKQLVCEKPDVVISYLTIPNLLLQMVSCLPSTWKIICSERNSKNEIFDGFRGVLIKLFSKKANYIVANSENGKKMWEKKCPRYKTKLRTIYNSVSVPDLNLNGNKASSDIKEIVVAASYQYTKNPVEVVKALLLLSDNERKRIHITWFGRKQVVAGDTRAYDEATKIIQENDLSSSISLKSETKDIFNEMIKADAIGLFSIVEGLPNTICEGMSLGKAIIMTPVSDYKYFLSKDNGFICDGYSADNIAKTLKDFIETDYELIESMGRKSKQIANTLFNYENNINKWYALVNSLMS